MVDPKEVEAETKRIAMRMVKEAIRQQGIRISSIEPARISKARDRLIKADPRIRQTAIITLTLPELIEGWADWSKYAATGEWQ